MQGKVMCFYRNRRYGFIKEMAGEELFFHEDDVLPGSAIPEKGTFVAFDKGQFNGREKATRVRILTIEEVLSGKSGAR